VSSRWLVWRFGFQLHVENNIDTQICVTDGTPWKGALGRSRNRSTSEFLGTMMSGWSEVHDGIGSGYVCCCCAVYQRLSPQRGQQNLHRRSVLPLVVYGYELWFLISGEGHKLQVYGNTFDRIIYGFSDWFILGLFNDTVRSRRSEDVATWWRFISLVS
jgi:hypothetical protein